MLPSQGRPLWGSQLSQRESQGVLPYLPAKFQFVHLPRKEIGHKKFIFLWLS